ncbi:MAG: hypothetical protein ACM3MG_13525 [Bacillota bacterium]
MNNFDPFLNLINESTANLYLCGKSGYSGPHTGAEVNQFIMQGKVDGDAQIWLEVEQKWEVLSKISLFKNTLAKKAISGNALPETNNESEQPWQSGDEFWRSLKGKNLFRSEEFSYLNEATFNEQNKIPTVPVGSPRRRLSLAFALGIFSSAAIVWFFHYQTISRAQFDEIPGVSRQENRELQAAVMENFDLRGPSAAIALAKSEHSEISFVVATNQLDGTRLKLKIEGVPDTLVGAYRFSAQSSLNVKKGLSRSPVFLTEHDKSTPTGEYKVTVYCENCEQTKALAAKTYFLGGEKNIEYDLRLRHYHEVLRKKAREEIIEARQLVETLNQEFVDTTARLESFIKNPVKTSFEFSESSVQMHKQLGDEIKKWSQQNDRNEVFYSELFSMLSRGFEVIAQAQDLQKRYASAVIQRSSNIQELERMLSKQVELVHSNISALRDKAEKLEHLPLSANGMPRVE